jgi:hypothetical protein
MVINAIAMEVEVGRVGMITKCAYDVSGKTEKRTSEPTYR